MSSVSTTILEVKYYCNMFRLRRAIVRLRTVYSYLNKYKKQFFYSHYVMHMGSLMQVYMFNTAKGIMY